MGLEQELHLPIVGHLPEDPIAITGIHLVPARVVRPPIAALLPARPEVQGRLDLVVPEAAPEDRHLQEDHLQEGHLHRVGHGQETSI